jgi:hypothetical protein
VETIIENLPNRQPVLSQSFLELIREEKIKPTLFPLQLRTGFTNPLVILIRLKCDSESLRGDEVVDCPPHRINIGRRATILRLKHFEELTQMMPTPHRIIPNLLHLGKGARHIFVVVNGRILAFW